MRMGVRYMRYRNVVVLLPQTNREEKIDGVLLARRLGRSGIGTQCNTHACTFLHFNVSMCTAYKLNNSVAST